MFERQTQEEAKQLARIQAQKEALERTLAAAPAPLVSGPTNPNSLASLEQQRQLAAAGYYQSAYQQQNPADTQAQQEAADRKKKEYESLRASNVALDLRNERRTQQTRKAAEPEEAVPTSPAQGPLKNPTDQPAPLAAPAQNADSSSATKKSSYDFNSAVGKAHRLFEGKIIETVLTNRLNGAFTGPVDCMVTTDVYAHDNQTLLIPQGARILGKVSAVNSGQQQRLFVGFHRIIMPDGYSVSLDQFVGMNQVGETGLRDIVNHHYIQIFGTSLALAAIGGVAQIGNSYNGLGYDPMVSIRSGISQSMAQSSNRVLDHFLNQLPTFIVRERARVKIYLSADLLLPAYQNHTMPGDL